MSKLVGYLIVFLAGILFFGCGGSSSSTSTSTTTSQLGTVSYEKISVTNIESSSSFIRGTGAIILTKTLGTTSSETNLKFTFTLDDGGSLTAHGFGDTKNENDVNVKLERSGTALTVTLASAQKSKSFTSEFAAVDASGEMTFAVDFHNGESPAHILIWEAKTNTVFDESTVLVNSEDAMSDVWTSEQGKGTYAGFTLNSAALTSIVVSDALFED